MRFIPVATIALFFAFFTSLSPLLAQTCEPVYEMIITLRAPRFGVPTVWDAAFGKEENIVHFSTGLPREDGTVLVVGKALAIDNYDHQEMVIARINRRGRSLMDKRYPLKTNEQFSGIVETDSEFVVASNFSGPKTTDLLVRVAWYGKDGKYKRDKIIEDNENKIEAFGIFPAIEGDGFILLVQAESRNEDSEKHGVLMRYTSQGELLWRRAYRVGIPNTIHGLSIVGKRQHYLASGEIMLDDGRIGGWILELNHDGTVVWQRTYARGAASVLKQAVTLGDNYVFIGDATPLDGTESAAWVMAVTKFGEPIWQRYYRGRDYAFNGIDLLSQDDGRIILMLNARAEPGSLQNSHIRLLTLSPRGVLLSDEPHLKGLEAKATQLIKGQKEERIMIANADVPPKPPEEEEKAEENTDEVVKKKPPKAVSKGWVVVATALDPHEDSCENEGF